MLGYDCPVEVSFTWQKCSRDSVYLFLRYCRYWDLYRDIKYILLLLPWWCSYLCIILKRLILVLMICFLYICVPHGYLKKSNDIPIPVSVFNQGTCVNGIKFAKWLLIQYCILQREWSAAVICYLTVTLIWYHPPVFIITACWTSSLDIVDTFLSSSVFTHYQWSQVFSLYILC